MKKTRTKKILTIMLLVVLLVCFFSDIPQSLINMLSYRAEAETDTTGISVIIRADYSSASEIVLTAVFKNEKNETVDAEDVSDDITYTWYKSTSSYASASDVPTSRDEIEYEVVTASASSSDNDEETASTSDNDADETEEETDEETEEETETESEEEASAEETEAQAKAVDNNAYSLFSWMGALEAEAADEGSNSITVEKGYVYYVSITVGGAGVTALTAEPKYVSIDIAGVKIQNDIYRDSVLTALLVNSEGDTLYFSDGSDTTTYNGSASYTWYHYYYASNNTYIYSEETYTYNNAPAPGNTGNYTEVGEDTNNTEDTDENTLTPLFTYTTKSTNANGEETTSTTKGISYYYYVVVTIDGETYTSDWRIGTVYAGITVEIEQVKADDSNDITLNMVVYDDNGDVMYEDGSTTYYYNTDYITTWYKSKEYFASTGDGTTADDNSEVATTATAPLGYAPQDYYGESNYMRVSNAVYNASTNTYGYTNSITVSDDDGGEVGRYYYVDINKNKTNGSAEAGADPVFVRNCTSTVVIEDDIATDGTFKAVVYNANGEQVTSTGSYTYTWYKTVSGTTNYVNDKDQIKTSNSGTFVSTYSSNNGTSYTTSAYYSDSGKFTRNSGTSTKTSEYGGTLPETGTYGLVRENFSEELQAVSEVFGSANYSFNTSGSGDKFALNDGVAASTSLNDGSSCNVATDEGQLRYYYVEVVIDDSTTYTSVVKYVKYSNQIENGGFQDSANSTTYDSSLTTYWQTTNMGYADSASSYGYPETYYRLHPLLEIATYTSSNAYGTYGNYYSFPGLSYDKENIETQETTDYINGTTVTTSYLSLNYDDDSTTDYLFPANQFCEINSTDTNTLYQTVMTVPKMPLYWSLTHHARTSTATKANGGLTTLSTSETLYQDDTGSDVTLSGLGVTSASAYVAVDIMYVVIMNETDAESLLANGKDLDAQQVILDNMIDSITQSVSAKVIQSSEDGISYLARYDGSYTYPETGGTTYENISVWRVQTGSTKVQLTFSSSNATEAAAAANNEELLEYYADKYGTVKSYSYTSGSYSYATFYTESQTYADEYTIPAGQYVSRYFFVAGNSTNTPEGYNDKASLSFGSYINNNGVEETVTNYNGLSRATNTGSAGNFIDNVLFMQKLEVEVNYWVYNADKGEYVLKEDDTEESSTYQERWVTADADTVAEYYSKYKFVGSYVSVDGGDKDTPDEEELGKVTSFKADTESALVLDLYYTPYDLEFEKEIEGLPATMSYADFRDALTITIYELTYDETAGTYTKSNKTSIDTKLEYDDTDKTLTLSTDYIFEKGYYLIEETTEILITDEFDGWFSVDMSVEIGGLEYNEDLGGFILHVDEDEDGIDLDSYTSSDGKMEITVVNTYKPVAVECVKSVIFGSTDLTAINKGLTGTDNYTGITSLKYESLTEYDEENSVDDTNITSDDKRRAVLSDDTLTYRMELTSTKKSTNVTVTDTVPDGCTLVEESIKILYQKRDNAGSHYGIVSAKLLTSDTSVSTVVNGDTTTWTVYDSSTTPSTKLYEITYDLSKREITWWISEIGFYEQYYVEYEVTVDQIKASAEKDILENTAEYDYLSQYVSSDSLTSVEMNMTTSEDNGKVTYTVTFDGLSDYTVTWLKNTLPEGFILDTTTAIKINDTEVSASNYTVEYYASNGDKLTGSYSASDISYFIITPDGTNTSSISTDSGKITLTFSGTYDSTAASTAGSNYRNATGIKFKDTNSNEYCAVVSYGEGVTNHVETDVTHLYFEIEKTIYENDPAQTFLFEVAYTPEDGTTPTAYSYVTINCTNAVTDNGSTYYTGSTIVQSDERGTYTITEVTNWSYTDYDDEVAASFTNLTEIDDTTLNTIMVEKSTEGITSVTLTLPGLYFTSNESTFPTALGTLASGTYATASFTDTASLYAYLSDQAYSYNVMQEN